MRLYHTTAVLALVSAPCWAGFTLDQPAPPANVTAHGASDNTLPAAYVPDDAAIPNAISSAPRPRAGVSSDANDELVVRATPAPAESWIVSPADATLRRVLGKWAARAGWQLQWDAAVDVPITVTASFDGDFRSAVKRLFGSLSASEVNLTALLYTGNNVLRVTESGRRAQ